MRSDLWGGAWVRAPDVRTRLQRVGRGKANRRESADDEATSYPLHSYFLAVCFGLFLPTVNRGPLGLTLSPRRHYAETCPLGRQLNLLQHLFSEP